MKFFTLLCLMLAMGQPGPARAGLELAWKACQAAGGDSTHTLDCRNPEGLVELFGTFQTPDTVKSFVALGVVLDFETETDTLPAFWHFEPQGCNKAGVTVSDALPATGCEKVVNIWGENGSDAMSAVAGFGPQFEGFRHRGRMVLVISRPATSPVTLLPGVRYYAFTLRLFSDNASEAGGRCAGCRTPLTIAWSAASLSRAGGKEGEPGPPDVVLTGSELGQSCVRANGARRRCAMHPPPKAWTDVPGSHDH